MLGIFEISALEACPRVAKYFDTVTIRSPLQGTFMGAERVSFFG